jgi:hypothetical protein
VPHLRDRGARRRGRVLAAGDAVNAPNDLTAKEQRGVRATLNVLRLRIRSWKPLGKTLRYEPDTLSKVASGGSAVTPTLALRLARHLGVTMEEVLAGECRHRRAWVPDPPASPGARDPPGGARTVLRLRPPTLGFAHTRPRSSTRTHPLGPVLDARVPGFAPAVQGKLAALGAVGAPGLPCEPLAESHCRVVPGSPVIRWKWSPAWPVATRGEWLPPGRAPLAATDPTTSQTRKRHRLDL